MALKRYDTYQEDQLPDGTTDPQGQGQTVQAVGEIGTTPAPYQPNQPQQRPELQSESGRSGTPPLQQVKTFEQMQQEGLARPPMPSIQTMTSNASLTTSDANTGQVNPDASAAPKPPKNPADLTQAEIDKMSVAERNALSEAFNRYQSGLDADANIASQPSGNWTPAAIAAKHAQMLQESGFGADGSYTPETEANPYVNANIKNTIAGFPSTYDPTKPVQPNNGAMVDGTYTLPSTTPAVFNPANQTTTGGTTGGTTAGSMTNPGTMTTGTTTGTNPSQQGNTFDLLTALVNGASGNGAGSQVQKETEAAILKYLQNPNPYGAQDVKDQYSYLGGQIDDQYDQNNQDIGEAMARRGLGYSTMYGGKLQDSNLARRTAKEGLATDLAHNFAQNYGSSQQAALGLGNQIGTQSQNNAQSWLSQLMGYGQQGFNNDLATNALNQGAQNSYQDFILRLLGLGYGGTA